MIIEGPFEVKSTREPPYDSRDGLVLGRTHIDKIFRGAIDGSSTVEMIAAGTATKGSAGYVAIERVDAVIEGKRGSFILQHFGTMARGVTGLIVSVVADSGTGELAGLFGTMKIDIKDGKHSYTFDYGFGDPPVGDWVLKPR